MSKPPPGSVRDTAALAARYSETSAWQHERGLLMIDVAGPSESERVLDLGCGTGELSAALAHRVGPSGRVIAIDPDPSRLEHARKNAPPALENLEFVQTSADDIHPIGNASIDLVYSNYALHWMLDPPAVFSEVRRVLRPGGRFVTEYLGMPIPLFVDLLFMMPDHESIMAENIFLDEAEWRKFVQASGLDIVDISWPRFQLDYTDLRSLFRWLEATSHGAFDSAKLGEKECAALTRKFPGPIACECQGLRLILRRPA